MNFTRVFHTFSSAEAQVVRSRLAAAGFNAEVAHELSALSLDGYALAAGGIEVRVPEAEAADALALLNSEPDNP